MSLKSQIEQARGNAAGLERLYRQTMVAGEEPAFKDAIADCVGEHPDDILFAAWAYRLDVRSPSDRAEPEGQTVQQHQARHWRTAVAASIILGILYALFAGDKPPVPKPGEANPLFWIGWGPLTALSILFYLTAIDRTRERIRWYGGLAAAVIPIGVYAALIAWNRTDPLAILIALHLPFVAWAAVGAALALGYPDPVRQGYAFLMKSVETVLTGGIYFGAGAIFLGLTYGIFEVLGIKLPQAVLRTIAAWGIGAIPILALASVYDPTAAPVAQHWGTGLARLLRILTRLILPLALGVLAVYVFWFIPAYFWRPFQEREVLIVYNATIMAILVLLTAVVTGPDEQRSPRQDAILRSAVLALGVLTLLLNLYALAVIVSRTFEFGLTPNRYAVFGWNIVTLFMLVVVVFRLGKAPSEQWVPIVRESIARVSVLAVAWALWVLVGLPLSFD
ncbi:MAG: hypothetical protein HY710_08760 [Candidatus Latescibacteria bacterium]|nr:hypothetical protein [Candidatus Latescibacterota bacterium]